jgi:hypothetical protein
MAMKSSATTTKKVFYNNAASGRAGLPLDDVDGPAVAGESGCRLNRA